MFAFLSSLRNQEIANKDDGGEGEGEECIAGPRRMDPEIE